MTLQKLFGNNEFIMYRKVNFYEAKREKSQSTSEKFRAAIVHMKLGGLKDGIKDTVYWNSDSILPEYKMTYTEFIDVNGKEFYLFDSSEDLKGILEIYRISNRTNSEISRRKTRFKEYENCCKVANKAFVQEISDTLLKLDTLNIIAWKKFSVTGAVGFITDFFIDFSNADIENVVDCTLSTERMFKKNKVAQLKKNSIYSELYELSDEQDIRPSKDVEKLEQQIEIWNKIVEKTNRDTTICKDFKNPDEYQKVRDTYKNMLVVGESLLKKHREQDVNDEIVRAGKQGEEQVEYVLKWLPSEFSVIDKGNVGIHLVCKSVFESSQEFDHIVISPQGVFLIETKNYSGKIMIDKAGNWVRSKIDGTTVGEENPAMQVQRHHRIMEGILGKVDIHDIGSGGCFKIRQTSMDR